MNLKKKEKEEDSKNNQRPEYVSNEQMIENGVEIVKFSEEETNKIMEQKAENEEKKKLKKQKKEKYKNKNKSNKTDNYHNNNNRETFIFHKRGASNFEKRGHRYNRTDYDYINVYDKYDNYDNNSEFPRNNKRGGYNHFYERGRPNRIFSGNRGRRGRYRY